MLESASRGGGSPWSRGVSLVPGGLPGLGGVSLVRGGVGLPGPGGGSPSPQKGLPAGGGVLPGPGGFSGEPPPLWTEWMTDTCKNITLATTSLRPVIIVQKTHNGTKITIKENIFHTIVEAILILAQCVLFMDTNPFAGIPRIGPLGARGRGINAPPPGHVKTSHKMLFLSPSLPRQRILYRC